MHEERTCPARLEEEFVNLAMGISDYFPELDLRFNRVEGTSKVRCIVPDLSDTPLEFILKSGEVQSLVYEAVLSIKALGGLFDS